MFACIYGQTAGLLSVAEAFAPEFEQTTPDTVVFDVDPLRRLYASPHLIARAIADRVNANVAIAETVDSAILAARNCSGISVNPDLSHLSITCLPASEEMLHVFESWGVQTLQQLANLPETGIAERFGTAGVYLQQLARGGIDRPLKIHRPATSYEDRIELDHPVSLLEPLLFLIARILNEQCEKLTSHAMAANEVRLILDLEDKTQHCRILRLPLPMRQSKAMLKLLQMDLEAHPAPAPTIALSVSLNSVPPRTIQHGIFLPLTPAPDKLELTLARVRALVGEENVGIPELLNTHHPHPFRLARALPSFGGTASQPTAPLQGFRYFRPPLKAMVHTESGCPVRVHASGVAGEIAALAGPWRTSGDWWTNTLWNRDEWDIALPSGSLYRIYCEPGGHWFIEGTYD